MPHTFSIAFYNLENLFDPLDNSHTLDKDFTPNGHFQWDKDKYQKKIENLSLILSKVGLNQSESPPLIIGVCEVENESCLEDLINTEHLKGFNYDYIFQKSPDSRGISVAFLYRKDYFKPSSYKAIKVNFKKPFVHDVTRDILHISGLLIEEPIHFILNHWPSRSDGIEQTRSKRMDSSNVVQELIENINQSEPKANIIIMGDFNDEPSKQSLELICNKGFINPMQPFEKLKKGSVKFKGKWIMFDQILFNLSLSETSWFNYLSAHIYVEPCLIQKTGKHRGSPKRTFIGGYFQGGFSDHLPVYIYFNKN